MVNYGVLSNVDLLDWALAQTVSGTFLTTPTVTGVSEQSYYHGVLSVTGSERGLMLWHLDGKLQTRNTISSGWSGSDWVPYTTATPPQEFDLPLAEGVSAVSSAYWKDQFGVVTGHFNVLASSSQTGSSTVIATLPEGFRPSRQANATAVVSSGESLGLLVLVTGEIQLQDAASVTLEGKYIKGLFSFVAAS